jgi:hypothetical protein
MDDVRAARRAPFVDELGRQSAYYPPDEGHATARLDSSKASALWSVKSI